MWRDIVFWPLALLLLLLSVGFRLTAMAAEQCGELVDRASGALSDWAVWRDDAGDPK